MGVGPGHSWQRFPWALLAHVLALAVLAVPGVGPSLVSLMPIVWRALYRLVSPWWLSLTFRVTVA